MRLRRRESSSPGPASLADIEADESALRERVRARLQLVDEGDYFAVLGVARTATGYEIRRAFLDLRRAFEPARVLTPSLADLDADLRTITSVLEEAYDVLKDSVHRERYRRAIEMPGG
jgi:preprotein translocase subunit Sec63